MACSLTVRDEMADVIEENLLAQRQLAIGFGCFGAHHQSFVPIRW